MNFKLKIQVQKKSKGDKQVEEGGSLLIKFKPNGYPTMEMINLAAERKQPQKKTKFLCVT